MGVFFFGVGVFFAATALRVDASRASGSSGVPYAAHRRSTIPWMRLMWLLLLQMKEKRHSAGSCRSMRHPGRNGSRRRNRSSASAHCALSELRLTSRLK